MTRSPSRPLFVVIEGPDRVGKDVQSDMLVERLLLAGEGVEKFSTPDYSTYIGQMILERLQSQRLASRTLADCYELECLQACCRYGVAARARESLAFGRWAVCSRWFYSALVYGTLDGVSSGLFESMYRELLMPDLAILLDASHERSSSRMGPSLYEASPERQREIAESYRRLWKSSSSLPPKGWWPPTRLLGGEGPNFVTVSADGSEEEVADSVWSVVSPHVVSVKNDHG